METRPPPGATGDAPALVGNAADDPRGARLGIPVPRAGGRVKPGTAGRVLLVEDHDDLRGVTAEILREAGFAVGEVRDGREALARLAAPPLPDVVVLDLAMPRVDGVAFRAAQRRADAWAAVPVVVLTGYPELAALTPGVAVVLHKPCAPPDLLVVLRRLCLRVVR